MWTSLTNRYQQNTVERRQTLQQDFLTYTYNPEHSVLAHIEAVKLLVQQFKDVGGTIDDEGTCNKIITSLPPSYDHFPTSWEGTPVAQRTLDDLTARLDREEGRNKRKYQGERSPEDKAFFGLPYALAAAPGSFSNSHRGSHRAPPYQNRGRGRGFSNQRAPPNESPGTSRSTSSSRCPYCNIMGHTVDECY